MTCMTSISEPTAATSSPDWNMIQEDILCPLCEYDLRMLTEPRCPECGYRFEWPDVLDPSRRLHRYLFEHHPERNWWSFWKTALGGLRPRKFWASLQPAQPSSVKRLILYWGLIVGVMLFGLGGQFGRAVINTQKDFVAYRATSAAYFKSASQWKTTVLAQHGSIQAYLDSQYPEPPDIRFFLLVLSYDHFFRTFLPGLVGYLLWPWLTILALLVFRWSMRSAKVKTAHVLRCVIYSFDIGIWIGLTVLVATGAVFVATSSAVLILPLQPGLAVLCLLMGGHAVYRLWTAYRKYLKFSHPFLTILASQAMVFLFLLWLILEWHLRGRTLI